jgi:hypothetical protein
MNDAYEEDLYELLGQSPSRWLEQAEFLKLSAVQVLEQLEEIIDEGQALPGIREKKLAYVQAFMLLMGLSFENLIKGAHTATTPGLAIADRVMIWKKHRGGHGISSLISLATSINGEERDLLRRLEEYTVWAGRYPIPLKAEIYPYNAT